MKINNAIRILQRHVEFIETNGSGENEVKDAMKVVISKLMPVPIKIDVLSIVCKDCGNKFKINSNGHPYIYREKDSSISNKDNIISCNKCDSKKLHLVT